MACAWCSPDSILAEQIIAENLACTRFVHALKGYTLHTAGHFLFIIIRKEFFKVNLKMSLAVIIIRLICVCIIAGIPVFIHLSLNITIVVALRAVTAGISSKTETNSFFQLPFMTVFFIGIAFCVNTVFVFIKIAVVIAKCFPFTSFDSYSCCSKICIIKNPIKIFSSRKSIIWIYGWIFIYIIPWLFVATLLAALLATLLTTTL